MPPILKQFFDAFKIYLNGSWLSGIWKWLAVVMVCFIVQDKCLTLTNNVKERYIVTRHYYYETISLNWHLWQTHITLFVGKVPLVYRRTRYQTWLLLYILFGPQGITFASLHFLSIRPWPQNGSCDTIDTVVERVRYYSYLFFAFDCKCYSNLEHFFQSKHDSNIMIIT